MDSHEGARMLHMINDVHAGHVFTFEMTPRGAHGKIKRAHDGSFVLPEGYKFVGVFCETCHRRLFPGVDYQWGSKDGGMATTAPSAGADSDAEWRKQHNRLYPESTDESWKKAHEELYGPLNGKGWRGS